MTVVVGEVHADYPQIELHLGARGAVFGDIDLGLANTDATDWVVLTTARQHGALTVEAQVSESAPPVDPTWEAACELSLRPDGLLAVSGWAAEDTLVIPAPLDRNLRVRYVVLDGQAGSEQFNGPRFAEPPAERYLLQVWPAPGAAPAVIASTVPWSQYWTFGPAAEALVRQLADVPDPDRLVAVVDGALAAHPDVAERLRAGDERYRSGIIRYAQALFRVTYHQGVYDEVRNDYLRLYRLIDERARR